jgi:hypothetical protein
VHELTVMALRGRQPGTGEHQARFYLRLPASLRDAVLAVAGESYSPWIRAALEEKLSREGHAQSCTHTAKGCTHI